MKKTLYILWFEGFDNAPFVVKKCLESWIRNNPTWEIVQLDKNSLRDYLDLDEILLQLNIESISCTALSDVVRINLLKKYGGLWVDATTYCTKPIDNWLEKFIKKGFFAFDFNGKSDRLVTSWFLYGEKDNYIINRWYNAVVEYCQKEKVIGAQTAGCTIEKWQSGDDCEHYFWFHYLFGDLYRSCANFKKVWDDNPKLSERGPHFIQTSGILNEQTNEVKEHVLFKKSPLYKLTYRYREDSYNAQCNLYYLLERKLSKMEIAGTYYEVDDCIPNVRFIHIGKSGGSSVLTTFKDEGIKLHRDHLSKPEYNTDYQYVFWIRNPLHRFISAFNYSYALVNFDTSHLDINKLTIENSLAPAKIRHKMLNGYTFTEEYDALINFFKTPNDLAESLVHSDSQIKNKAVELMNHPIEHIHKGIGWYLNDGEFVRKYADQILFVGKVETMELDIESLAECLNISLTSSKKVRENKNYKRPYLSPLAIEALLKFYEKTDYKALAELRKAGLIDTKTYQSYFLN